MSATDHLPTELLSAHLDGETTPEERARVEPHLATCEGCRAELEDLRRIADASTRLDVPEVPEGLRDRIGAALARPRARRRAWIGAAASLAAVGLVATTWYLQGPAPVTEPPAPAAPPTSLAPPPEPPAAPKAGGAVTPPLPPRPRRMAVEAPAAEQVERARRESEAPAPTSDAQGGVEPPTASPMAKAAGPEMLRVGDDACGVVPFVEVAVDVALDRAALEAALRRQGARPQPETRRGVLDVIVPRVRWPECRRTLEASGIVLDEAKVEALGGSCIGVTVRFPAP